MVKYADAMQFIVKPQSNPYWRIINQKDAQRKGLQSLVVLALVGCFSTGLLIGWITHLDTTCLTKGPEEHHLAHESLKTQIDSHDPKEHAFLVVLITSAKNYKDRRDAIRESWLRLHGDRRLKYYFALGSLEMDESDLSALEKEKSEHNDMIIFPQVKDTYSGLTHKLLASLKWIANKHSFSYLLKVDDDSFVHLDVLYDELAHRKETSKLYWGYFVGASHIQKSGQWAESNWFLCDRYLPYAVGGGYVLSSDLVDYITSNAHLLQLYMSEDVSVGTWLSPLKIQRVHDQRFDTWYKSRGCANDFLITHKHSPESLRDKYNNLQSVGTLCIKEKSSKGHLYNWKVVPSKCCAQQAL